MMSNKKILSALCYFSVFFFPLLLPFVIYMTSDEVDVKFHAKRSFISHMIPVLLLLVGAIILSFSIFSVEKRMMALVNHQFDFWSFFPLIFTVTYSVLFIFTFTWNVFQGVKVLKWRSLLIKLLNPFFRLHCKQDFLFLIFLWYSVQWI